MKNKLNIELLKLNILQPILTIFVVFFIIAIFAIIYLENNIYDNLYTKIYIYIFFASVFTSILFYFIQYYMNKYTQKINKIYTSNIKDIEFGKKYLKALEDASPNLIVALIDMDIEKVNQSFLTFTGYKDLSSFTLEHKCISELFITKNGYLSSLCTEKNWLDYVITNPDLLHKVIMKKEDKEYIFILEARKLIIDNKLRSMTTLVDITELENLQTRFKLAINGTQDGLWDWNLLTNEVYFSTQWKKQLGYEDSELCNELKTWKENVHPDDLKQAMFDIQANIDQKTPLYENQHRLKHKDGSWVWILDRGQTVYDEDNRPIRMVGFHSDITKQKIIEQELHDKDEMMIAQSQNAAMGEMISMIAHQWRQPLSVISMGANNIMADIELEMIDETSLKEISTEIIQQTQELSTTIDDFRDFFKPKKEKELIFVHTIFDDAFNIIGNVLENYEIKLIKEFESVKKINTYSRELMHVILNILKNAKDILVENNIKDKTIHITTKDYDDKLEIEIRDNAGGIPTDILPKIFEPYFSTKDDKTGTGLGLYMCKTIIEKHLNGEITAINKDNGASFKIIISDIKND